MFVAAGDAAESFCAWAAALGEPAEVLGDRLPTGVGLLHLEARGLLATQHAAALRRALDAARKQGGLVSIDLGSAEWMRAFGSSRAAYQLATIQPDILFAGEAAADELGAPLEGVAAVPVVMLGAGGCSVFRRRLVAPALAAPDPAALMAAFCVAFLEGAAPVEAAGRAVLAAVAGVRP